MSDILLFNKWNLADIAVEDAGLRRQINLKPIIVPRTGGRYAPKEMQKDRMKITTMMRERRTGV